jgi:hypothetical protein
VEHQRQRWDEHADEVMDLHLRQWPGTRPRAWWRWSAPEPRRVLSGAALLKPKVTPTSWEFWWRERFGVQAMVQIRPRDVQGVPALIESQASYLARLALLTNEERARLTPAAFEAEPYDPFRCSEEELERGKAAGGDAARRARQLERDLGNPRAIRA